MHLFVSVPSHSGTVVTETALTMVAVQEIASRRGWSITFSTVTGAVIAEVRNAIVGQFLSSGADRLLMIDADQSLGRDGLERMLDLDQPVVGCIYPMRKLHWSQVDLKTATSIDDVLYQASDYVGRLEFGAEGTAQVVNGFAKALHVGTGLLLVRRDALQTLMTHFPDVKDRGFHGAMYPGLDAYNWGFFNHLSSNGECSLAEDISFCHRWRASGGEIWADVTSIATHTGTYHFRGNYLDYLRAKGAIHTV